MRSAKRIKLGLVALSIGVASAFGSVAAAYDIQDAPLECGDEVKASIKLVANLGPCEGHGLVVTAHNVTIDLNGKSIYGKGKPSTSGIYSDGYEGLTIKGGTIFGFVYGVELESVDDASIDSMLIRHNKGHGLIVDSSDDLVITDSTSWANYEGLLLQDSLRAAISHSQFVDNESNGLRAVKSGGIKVVSSIAKGNGFTGVYLADSDSVIKSSEMTYNHDYGIQIQGSAVGHVVRKNTVKDNGFGGITSDTPAVEISLNKTVANGFSYGVDDDQGLGISAPAGAKGSDNTAKKNDDPKQCLPKKLCA